MSTKEKILRIMELALEINPPAQSGIGETKTAVFVDWSPHCNLLSVRVFHGGWSLEKSNAYDWDEFYIYTDSRYASEELDDLYNLLTGIMKKEAAAA